MAGEAVAPGRAIVASIHGRESAGVFSGCERSFHSQLEPEMEKSYVRAGGWVGGTCQMQLGSCWGSESESRLDKRDGRKSNGAAETMCSTIVIADEACKWYDARLADYGVSFELRTRHRCVSSGGAHC